MGYDLHVHSIYSDGTLKPAVLVAKAMAKGLNGLALTDHDTIAGLPEATLAARELKLTFIPGVELTTDYGDKEVHVLGYNFLDQGNQLAKKLETVIASRNDRARLIIKKLNQHSIPLTWEQVQAQTTSNFVGRTHIFRALENARLIPKEHSWGAFNYYLGKNGVAYVPHQELGTREAIDLINNTQGISVLAHPGRMGEDALIRELIDFGLQGIEIFYPAHTPEMVAHYLKVAADFKLIVTGGSDYHGAFSHTKMGDAQVPEVSEWFEPKKTGVPAHEFFKI